MKPIKYLFVLLLLALLGWAGYVTWFEAWLGYAQPMRETSIELATFGEAGDRRERVLSPREVDGNIYIAVNHWPRGWYTRALAIPEVEVRLPGSDTFAPFTAIPLEGAELERVEEAYPVPLNFKIRTGFPPRRFMRLDPRPPAAATP